MNAKAACGSPFEQAPSCYPKDTGYTLMDDDYCAAEFANLYNVPEEYYPILQELTETNIQLHAECGSIHVEVRLPLPNILPTSFLSCTTALLGACSLPYLAKALSTATYFA